MFPSASGDLRAVPRLGGVPSILAGAGSHACLSLLSFPVLLFAGGRGGKHSRCISWVNIIIFTLNPLTARPIISLATISPSTMGKKL